MAGDIPLLAALKTSMRWHQERQRLLAENVANANTAGYQAQDLAPLSFQSMVDRPGFQPGVMTAQTDIRHIAIGTQESGDFAASRDSAFEVTPNGNGVTLEDQMMKLTANQLDYQAATTLYSRGLGLIRTALRGKA